jgi:hypothetical protein
MASRPNLASRSRRTRETSPRFRLARITLVCGVLLTSLAQNGGGSQLQDPSTPCPSEQGSQTGSRQLCSPSHWSPWTGQSRRQPRCRRRQCWRATGASITLVRVTVNKPATRQKRSWATRLPKTSCVQPRRISQGGLLVDWPVQAGPVPESTIQAAEVSKADVIAIATHGRVGISRASREVSRHAWSPTAAGWCCCC